jgi:hypothetical protein
MKLIFAVITAFAFIASAQAQEADTKKLTPGKLPSAKEVGKAVATDAKAAASGTVENAKAVANAGSQKPAADKPAMKATSDAPKADAPATKKKSKKGKKKARKATK